MGGHVVPPSRNLTLERRDGSFNRCASLGLICFKTLRVILSSAWVSTLFIVLNVRRRFLHRYKFCMRAAAWSFVGATRTCKSFDIFLFHSSTSVVWFTELFDGNEFSLSTLELSCAWTTGVAPGTASVADTPPSTPTVAILCKGVHVLQDAKLCTLCICIVTQARPN